VGAQILFALLDPATAVLTPSFVTGMMSRQILSLPPRTPRSQATIRRSSPNMACSRVFLDVGANIGVNMRFLYEGRKYPRSRFMVKTMDYVLGNNRSDVCYYGFEANPIHFERLARLKSHFESRHVHVWNQPVATHGKDVTFYHANNTQDSASEEWSFSGTKQSPDAIPVKLKAFNFPKWFAAQNFDPATTSILMKIDIEGSEYELLASLLASGLLCKVKVVTIEWHPQFCNGKWCQMKLEDYTRLLPSIGCNVKFIARDDESYLHDGIAL
jgi:FkbM family methyltransferase